MANTESGDNKNVAEGASRRPGEKRVEVPAQQGEPVASGSVSACIVIPTYKRPDLLARTLTAVADCAWPATFTGVWVVENGPLCGAERICAGFTSRLPIHYIHVPAPGLSNARNAGVHESTGDIVLFLDDDVRPDPEALSAYAAAFAAYGTSAFYGGPVQPDYEVVPPEWLTPFLPMSAFGFTLGDEDRTIEEATFLGGNHAMPRAVLEQSAGYDSLSATESGGGIGEEMRLQERLLTQGLRARYVAGALVGHYVPEDRCSPAWVLLRKYRIGYTAGSLRRAKFGKGVPRWVWRQLVESFVRERTLRLLGRPLQARFDLQAKLAFARGYIAAYRGAPD